MCCRCCADVTIKALLVENEKVLKLYRSEILQTEIRVLYELLYVLNNSYRNNKTFKALKQVRDFFFKVWHLAENIVWVFFLITTFLWQLY